MDTEEKYSYMAEEEAEEMESYGMPHDVVDQAAFGRRLRALRILNGYVRASDFVVAMRNQMGVDITRRTLYAIERGEQMPHLNVVIGSIVLLKPSEGLYYYAPAFRADVMPVLNELGDRP